VARQAKAGKFEIPEWDQAKLKKVRETLNVLAADMETRGCFGDKSKLDLVRFMLCAAYG